MLIKNLKGSGMGKNADGVKVLVGMVVKFASWSSATCNDLVIGS